MAGPRRFALRPARLRHALALWIVVVPTAGLVLTDVWLRGREIASISRVGPYVGCVVLSLASWGLLVRASMRRRGLVPLVAALVALVLAAAGGLTQATSFGQFRAYADPFAMGMGVGMLGTVVDPLGEQLPRAMRATAFFTLLALVVLAFARWLGRAPVRESRVCLAVACVALAAQAIALPLLDLPSQAASPDVLFVAAVGKAIMVGPMPARQEGTPKDWGKARRRPTTVPTLSATTPTTATRRNVLLILTESVRADAVCSAFAEGCPTTPATNRLLPNRLPLLRMHASATFTAVSFASITSGLLGTASAEAYTSAPLLWDYAKAAGLGTAYLSAQHATFAGAGEWLAGAPIDRLITAETLDREAPQIPGADDRHLLRRAPQELAQLHEPFVAVVHLASTHYPYVIDPAITPFVPMAKVSSAEAAPALHNRYRNSVAMQDRAIARFIEEFRQTEAGARTVLVFTSDHGESFFEHEVGLHGSTAFEDELHVPAWIDAPPGVLAESERSALVGLRDRLTMNVDLLPTLLDLAGIWRAPQLAPFRARQQGFSWLGDEIRTRPAVVTTNCSSLWPCGIPVWMALADDRKWVDRGGTASCYDFVKDPHDMAPLPANRCADLEALAKPLMAGAAARTAAAPKASQ